MLVILSGIFCIIGYYEFTRTIESQYADSAYHTARTAALYLTPDFLRNQKNNPREWQMQYQNICREWSKLVDTQDATLIYLFTAEGNNHEDVVFLINVLNSSSQFPAFNSGFYLKQTDGRYLAAFKAIYDDKQSRYNMAVYRPKTEEFVSGNHVTVMIPIYLQGKIFAILGVEREMAELTRLRENYIKQIITAAAILLLIVIVSYGFYLNRKLIVPIKTITNETIRFAHENTQPQVSLGFEVKINNEIGQLAKMIDVMEKDIITYIKNLTKITQEKEQIRAELDVATQIQADMLPRIFPPFPDRKEFDIYASMTPAKEVGGDFYDFFMIDDNHLALVIADVSGKGVPAALFMVIAKTLIKNRALTGGTPSEILHDVNNQLCEGNEADLFVTVWLGILEISTGKITASNAGHEYPAIKHVNSSYELYKTKQSPAVATMEGLKFRQTEFNLMPGDYLYLYTDGVAEATNIHEELFGTGRMIDALNNIHDDSVSEIINEMKKAVDDFTGEAPQFDDVTMICVKYYGCENMKELRVDAEIENLDSVMSFIDEELEKIECPIKIQTQIDLSVEEIFVNIAHYAYKPNHGEALIRISVNNESIVITFIDSGIPYNPLEKPDPDIKLNAEERQIGGLGIYLVKKNMDDVFYEYKEGKNILIIKKNLHE